MSAFQLAQLNLAALREPLDSPLLADFVANLDRINALADAAPCFIWRLQGDGGDATHLRPFGNHIIVNMSVWKDAVALNEYVYKSDHVAIMRRRKEWFERMAEAWMVLWWVPAGHRPTLAEAAARLAQLRTQGPSAKAFTFRRLFAAPDAVDSGIESGDECPAL